ncbi:unnamed protein product [Lampetra planeri]
MTEGSIINVAGLRALSRDTEALEAHVEAGIYGAHDTLRQGFTSVRNNITAAHPLEASEKQYDLQQQQLSLQTLRRIQGLHAPLRLQMEMRATSQVQRLPCLQSSRVALDTIRGFDDYLGFEHVLNDPEYAEAMGEPHVMMEKQLGLL